MKSLLTYYTGVVPRGVRSSWRRQRQRARGLALSALLLCGLPAALLAQDLAFPGGAIWQVTFNPPPVQLPAFDASHAYLVLRDGTVCAVDHATGSTRWTSPAVSTVRPASSGRRLVGADGATAWALDAESGRPAWRRELPSRASAAPAVTNAGAAFLTGDGDLVLLAWEDGQEVWSVRLPAAVSAPVAAGADRAFVGLEDGRVLAVALADGATAWTRTLGGRVLSLTPLDDRLLAGAADDFLYAMKAKDGGVAWRWRTGGDVVAHVVADARRVYFISRDAMLRGADRRHGDLRWQRPLTTRAVGDPLIADTKVIVAGVSPELRAFRTSDGGLLATAPVPGRPLLGPYLAPEGPAAPVRLVLLTAGGHLMAIGQTVEPMLVPLDVLPGRKLPPEVLPEIIKR